MGCSECEIGGVPCIACEAGKYISNLKLICGDTCPEDECIYDNSNLICKPSPITSCSECIGDEAVCSRCISTKKLKEQVCVDLCGSGYCSYDSICLSTSLTNCEECNVD